MIMTVQANKQMIMTVQARNGEPDLPGTPATSPVDQERDLLFASMDELSAEDRMHVTALVESPRNKAARTQRDGDVCS